MDQPGQREAHIGPVSAAAPGPLYQQIVDAVRREVGSGRLPPGTEMPSFRKFAEQLVVSVITVKRAYEELERAGIIYRRQGLGTFVAEHGAARNREAQAAEARGRIISGVRLAREAGLSLEELQTLWREALTADDSGDSPPD